MNSNQQGRVLVTGGCGFIGAAVASAFADAGRDVRVVSPRCRRLRDEIEYVDLDIADGSRLTEACRGVETLVHCASIVQTRNDGRDTVWRVNHGGTQSVLEACRKHRVPRLVHISSASVVYEGRDIEGGDESLPYSRVSLSAYADSKIAAEKEVLAFAKEGVTSACALRPHIVFGPGDTRFLPNILDRSKNGIREVGRRRKLSDFVYISNVVDAVLAAERALGPTPPVSGQAYFITNGEPVPFFGFVERLLAALGHPPIKRSVPFWAAYAGAGLVEAYHALTRTGVTPEDGISRFAVRYLATHHYFSIDKARRDLHWTPRVSLADGIALTAAAR